MNTITLVLLSWFTLGILGELLSNLFLKKDEEMENWMNFHRERIPILFRISYFLDVILYGGQFNLLLLLINWGYIVIVRPILIIHHFIKWLLTYIYRYYRLKKLYKRVRRLNPNFSDQELVDGVYKIMVRWNKIHRKTNNDLAN